MSSSSPIHALALLIVAGGVAGCPGKPPEVSRTPHAIQCVRDVARLDTAHACRAHDDCPCGAHCALGACVTTCRSDDACEGDSVCDLFGVCRDPEYPALSTPPVVATTNLTLDPIVVALAPDGPGMVRLRAGEVDVGAVRVVAPAGAQVRCAAGDTFASVCRVDRVPAGVEHVVDVQLTADATAPLDTLRVFHGAAMATAALVIAPAEGAVDDPGPKTYVGSARRVATSAGAAPWPDEATDGYPISASVSASVGGTYRLVLEDPARALLPRRRVVGTLTEDQAGWSATLPDVIAIRSAPASDLELLAHFVVSDVQVGRDFVGFTVRSELQGLAPGVEAATIWRVVLEANGTDIGSIGAPNANQALTLDPERTREPNRWETLIASTVTARFDASSDPAELLERHRDDHASVYLCEHSLEAATHVMAAEVTWNRYPALPVNTAPMGIRYNELLDPTVPPVQAHFETVRAFADDFGVPPTPEGWTYFRDLTPAFGQAMDRHAQLGVVACGFEIALPAHYFYIDEVGRPRRYVERPASVHPIDHCTALAIETGCAPEPMMIDPTFQRVGTLIAPTQAWSSPYFWERSWREPQFVDFRVTHACRFNGVTPRAASECAQRYLCYEPVSATTLDSLHASTLSNEALPLSGELECEAGARSAGVEYAMNFERSPGDPARLDAAELLAACIEDLERFHGELPTVTAGDGAGLAQILRSEGCIDAARHVRALAAGARSHDTGYTSVAGWALHHRLAFQWLEVHQFIASETHERMKLRRALGDSIVVPRERPVGEILDLSLEGWALLLHPRFVASLSALPADVLAAPDYRARLPGVIVLDQPFHTQRVGLPVLMLETLRAQLALARARLEDAYFTQDLDPGLDDVAHALAYAAAVRPLARAWTERARPENPSWLADWERALAELDTTEAELVRLVHRAMAGTNPLGIADEDLPLYFLGDPDAASARFSAISDYLIGDGRTDAGWAPRAVNRATAALGDARAAWTDQRDRALRVASDAAQHRARLNETRRGYGERILELCGDMGRGVDALSVLDEDDVYGASCWSDTTRPECAYEEVELDATNVDEADVKYQLCYAGQLVKRFGLAASYGSGLDAHLALAAEQLNLDVRIVDDAFEWAGGVYPLQVLRGLRLSVPPSAETDPDVYHDARATCAARYPDARTRLPSRDDLPASPLADPSCYRGAIGGVALELRSAASQVEIARAELADLGDRYDIAMRSCMRLKAGNAERAEAIRLHTSTMQTLAAVKLGADQAANVAKGVKSAASPFNAVFSFGASAASAAVETGANAISIGMQFAMDEATRNHERALGALDARTAEDRCFIDAEMHLVGARTATLRIQKALQDAARSSLEKRDLEATVERLIREGRAAVSREVGSMIRPLAGERWIDERLDTLESTMRIARRATYLAVRAVEYEYQSSLALRADVIAAQRPDQLSAVLDELASTAATRRIEGNAPRELLVVLSLRDHLLQLEDRSGAPDGELNLSATQRFRLLLADERFAHRDDDGTYLGQRIPFTIGPLSALGLGDASGIPIFATQDCAERLWSVNASILGEDALRGGGSFTRLNLLKRNTFYSQWCTDDHPDPMQVASVYPSKNLFKDPIVGGESQATTSGGDGESIARVQAYTNVGRSALEAEAYAQGATAELAGRGVYGDYALFLPAELMSRNGGDGLDLDAVDDILLRLDYVSVARR
ncbi:MAG: hypothetical protein RMA76_04925 [Deltaproteobacteria bacterium]|jgi:hypothetical protein